MDVRTQGDLATLLSEVDRRLAKQLHQERLWDSLSQTPADVPVTPAQLAERDRRSVALDQDAAEAHALRVAWDEVVRL